MTDVAMEIHISKPLLDLGISREDIQQRIQEWLVLSLFTDERISSGKAARLLSMSRFDFLTLLRRRGIAYLDYSRDEWAEEVETARSLRLAQAG
jgi:predicted HTH domain antitoxin